MGPEREAVKKVRTFQESDDEELEEFDETSCDGSTTVSEANSRCETPNQIGGVGKVGKKRKRGKKTFSYKHPKLNYKCTGFWKEDHGQPLFGVSVNHHLSGPSQPVVFATVGYNRVTIYEALPDSVKLVQCYADPDADENFYTCAWSYDSDTGRPVLAAAGSRGIIRLFSPASMNCIRHYVGHGNAVNELKFHPRDPNLLLSVSKDHALRLWNVKTEHNIAIFGGVEGHRDEVLSADFNMEGTKIISCGMDHSLKMWRFDTDNIKEAVEKSYTHNTAKTKKAFPTELCHFPDFSTRDIHRNYVDCCRWFGDFVLSKSCENSIVCWKPGGLDSDGSRIADTIIQDPTVKPSDSKVTIIHKLDYKDCEIWFVRFAMDEAERILALGNQLGKTYVWDLDVAEPAAVRQTVLSHPKCTTAVRQTGLSRDGNILLCVCDDGTIWRWDKQN